MSEHSTGQGVPTNTNTGVDYRAAIDVVTSYIQVHIGEQLELVRLAGLAGFSPFHFHRIFAALMGETVAEYVRRVRLAAAVQWLLHSNEPVTEIALAVGYETPAAFTKAFRQRFGIAPTALRTMERTTAFTLLLEQPRANAVKGRKLTPEIRTLPDQRVLYARGRGLIDYTFFKAAEEAFTILICYLRKYDLMDKFTACIGITPDDYSVVPHAECRFDAGVVLKEDVPIEPTGKVAVQVLEAGRWAVFQHKGSYSDTRICNYRNLANRERKLCASSFFPTSTVTLWG
ncbi:MAG: helix-turn-helix domain-containing protein [Caldilineaceae bacterium]